jgi:hypothetical protein
MMASTTRFIQDPSFPQDGLPEGALPDHLPFLGRVDDHVHADARPQDIGDDIPEPLGEVAVRPADIAVGQGIPPRPGAEQDDAFGSASGLPSKSEGLRRGPNSRRARTMRRSTGSRPGSFFFIGFLRMPAYGWDVNRVNRVNP